MAKTVWKNDKIIKTYELAKSGLNERKIAAALGISFATFVVWEKKKPVFKMALEMGRKAYKKPDGSVFSFRDYVYGRMSNSVRVLWDKINKCDRAKNGTERIEAILSKRGVRVRQQLFIYAWTSSNFSISNALRKVNLSRQAFEGWKKDPDFCELINELEWHKGNFFEDHLCKLIAGGDSGATLFANRTYNRGRGYNDKVDVNMELKGEIMSNVVNVDSLELPVETRKKILTAMRQKKQDLKAKKSNDKS